MRSNDSSRAPRQTVVLTAFACDPNIPSEPTIGWLFLLAIAEAAKADGKIDVVAFMNERSKVATDERLRQLSSVLPLETVGVALPRRLRFLENPYLTRFESLVWTWGTRRRINALQRDRHVLLCRHVTFASELLPTPLTGVGGGSLKAWGPVGSSGEADVYLVRPRHRKWLVHYFVQRLRDRVSATMATRTSRSIDVVVASSTRLGQLLKSSSTDVVVAPNSVLDDELMASVRILRSGRSGIPRARGGRLRIICVGNLVYLKRFELAISALTDELLENADLVIVGKPAPGRENYLRTVAEDLGVAERVRFTGQLPRERVLGEMAQADVLFHPSARESNSGVVAEATALGLPVACFAGTGAAVILDSAGVTGIKIRAHRRLSTKDLAEHLVEASGLSPAPVDKWSHGRLVELERALIRTAREREGAV